VSASLEAAFFKVVNREANTQSIETARATQLDSSIRAPNELVFFAQLEVDPCPVRAAVTKRASL
jgi:hypothetical protein